MTISLAITMGCPVGIGPEIILKLFGTGSPWPGIRPVVFGDPGVLAHQARLLGLPARLVPWQPGETGAADGLAVAAVTSLDPRALAWGQPNAATGRAMAACIQAAVAAVQAGLCAGLVTAPIAKGPLAAAGLPYPGHTEMLAALCRCDDFAMMMAGSRLKVSLVTIHTALARVPALLSQAEVLRLVRLTHRALRQDFGLAAPRLAVAGLNPHAGEGGLFGDEEARLIAPAVAAARREGVAASGPLPPDTVFHAGAAGAFDAVVAMYHDQGLIPFKLLHFQDGVNVTIGLPLVRTSVDHGTAYDIAGRGVASTDSLAAAVQLAAAMVEARAAGGAPEGGLKAQPAAGAASGCSHHPRGV
ncbi:MAG: 4-hydroxythreonine-4-phosphate dehydrogenase PdxA [Thermodesulfobacteriota bacterium]